MRQLTTALHQHPRTVAAVAVAVVVLALYLRRMKVSAAIAAKLAIFPEPNRSRFSTLIAAFEAQGFTVYITSTYRAGEGSLHGKWRAVDLNVMKGGKLYTSKTSKAEWEATGLPALAVQLGFRWGGHFVTPWTFNGVTHPAYDPIHFDLGLA
ncbi:MAG: M15 family metallopeptidase [Janthinobacterium lividum]